MFTDSNERWDRLAHGRFKVDRWPKRSREAISSTGDTQVCNVIFIVRQEMKRMLFRLGLSALVTSALFGCGGGSDGINGSTVFVPVPVNTTNQVVVASNAMTPTSASVATWRALAPQITVTGVTIADQPVVKFTVTDAAGNAVVGLGNKSLGTSNTSSSIAGLTNVRFTLAKLMPATATEPSRWVSYLVTKPLTIAQKATGTIAATDSCTADKTWCGTYPTTEQEGTLEDNGDGTYIYTFARDITKTADVVASLVDSTLKLKKDLGDVSYNPGLTHRVGIQISGAAPGTGSNVPNATTVIPGVNIAIPTNVVYDFRPDGGAVTSTRSIVDKISCDSCHNGKGLAHGQGRNDPNYCVTCHTDQIKYGMSAEATRLSALVLNGTTQNTTSVLDGRAIGNLPNFLHKIHMGAELTLSGYNYIPNNSGVGMNFNEVEWIQDPRDCTKCHSGADKTDVNQATKTKDGDNWKTKPSRLACGACHDNVNFANGVITTAAGTTNHSGGAAADDSSCSSCHTAAAVAEHHRAEAPTANNPVVIDGISTISYEIKSVTVSGTPKKPQIKFRIIKDGAPVLAFNTSTNPIVGFSNGPSFYIAYAVPQDGIAAPADFNTYQSSSLASLITATDGTLSVADADGYITAELTADKYAIPVTAKMVTAAMIGNFRQVSFTGVKADILATKYNPTNGTVSKGLVIKTPLKKLVASGYTVRRVVVDTNKCESCHEQLGTAVDFHGGARNDATACAICHNPNRTSGGWSANASTFIHGIHAGTSPTSVAAITASGGTGIANVGDPGSGRGGAGANFSSGKRYVPFSWHRDAAGWNAAAFVYPGILKRCDNCHVANAVNFGANGASLLPNLLWSTSGTGTYTTDANKVFPRDPVTGAVIYIATETAYGSGFSYAPATDTAVPAATTTLVESPITAACFACHDGGTAKLHMAQYGGVMYGTRAASTVDGVLTNKETCLVCHGMGRDQDVAVVHAK